MSDIPSKTAPAAGGAGGGGGAPRIPASKVDTRTKTDVSFRVSSAAPAPIPAPGTHGARAGCSRAAASYARLPAARPLFCRAAAAAAAARRHAAPRRPARLAILRRT
jgi:hypothetical protein